MLHAVEFWLDGFRGVLHPRPASEPDFMPIEEIMTDERRHRFNPREDLRLSALLRLFKARRHDAAIAVSLDAIKDDASEIVVTAAHDADLVVIGVACGDSHREAETTIHSLPTEATTSVLVVREGELPILLQRRFCSSSHFAGPFPKVRWMLYART